MNSFKEADPCVINLSDASSLSDNSTAPFEYVAENIWNKDIFAPEFSSDFTLLHNDMEEIKALIRDIKNFLNNFFTSPEE